jgi:hypothetical protein
MKVFVSAQLGFEVFLWQHIISSCDETAKFNPPGLGCEVSF